ncbi:hypothetical protein [Brevibacillus sp. IT-7CA2]|uniref:hypothetical protein n=1 Tax=Brevibacillus sp. IT-7CA2 TaxID=3026436 RepID=UPI0039DF67AA
MLWWGKKRISSLRFGTNSGSASNVEVSKKYSISEANSPPFIPVLGWAPEALGLEMRFFLRSFGKYSFKVNPSSKKVESKLPVLTCKNALKA